MSYKISAVSFLNTRPLIYGLERGLLPEGYSLEFDIPSLCATRLAREEVAVGLIPVIETQRIDDLLVAPQLCIGATSSIHTVLLVAERPVQQLKTILLDYSSRTSVALLKILCSRKWGVAPEFIEAEPGYEQRIGGDTGGLIIGDRAFAHYRHWPAIYDLAGEWVGWTHTPFVFAVWAGRAGAMTSAFAHILRRSLEQGLEHLDAIALDWYARYGGSLEDYLDYLHNRVDYSLQGAKALGLQRFLRLAEEEGLISRYRQLRFVSESVPEGEWIVDNG